jgi:hypothetical protein
MVQVETIFRGKRLETKVHPKDMVDIVQRDDESEMGVAIGDICRPQASEGMGKPARHQEGDRIELVRTDQEFIDWVVNVLTSVHKEGDAANPPDSRPKRVSLSIRAELVQFIRSLQKWVSPLRFFW